MESQINNILEKINNLFFLKYIGIVFLVLIVFGAIFTGFFFQWKYVITNILIILTSSGISVGFFLIAKKYINSSLVNNWGTFFIIYLFLIVYFLAMTITTIIFLIVGIKNLFKRKTNKKIFRRLIFAGLNLAVLIPIFTSTLASISINEQRADKFTTFSIKALTLFQGDNPSIIISKIKIFFQNDQNILKTLEKPENELTDKEKLKITQTTDVIIDTLNNDNLREKILKTFSENSNLGSVLNNSINAARDNFKEIEKQLSEEILNYENKTEKEKKDILLSKLKNNSKINLKSEINKNGYSKIIDNILKDLKPEATNDLISILGKKIDKMLGFNDLSADILKEAYKILRSN
ncbi:hypothetical protein [Mycoplasmopsis cricetuli]|uniref:hypothetical protein n=1 Tax=Mycoplasmopsis cricetuli TaxID=171283 RepID=UPI0004720EE3|nr:hypothetical protein [Mycoplasmopsis cricetuli]